MKCTYILIHKHTHISTYLYTCLYLCIYIYIYVHIINYVYSLMLIRIPRKGRWLNISVFFQETSQASSKSS